MEVRAAVLMCYWIGWRPPMQSNISTRVPDVRSCHGQLLIGINISDPWNIRFRPTQLHETLLRCGRQLDKQAVSPLILGFYAWFFFLMLLLDVSGPYSM